MENTEKMVLEEKKKYMKTVGKAYLVLSIRNLNDLLKIAKKQSEIKYGKVEQKSCIVLRSELTQFENDKELQFSSSFEVD